MHLYSLQARAAEAAAEVVEEAVAAADNMKKTTLNITGMDCASCAAVLNKGLAKLEGVAEANVNFSTSRADVMFDENRVSEADLLDLVKKKGFSARISMIYQGESLFVDEEGEKGRLARSVGATAELDNFVGATTRWDLVVKQKIKKKFQVFLYINNLTNVKETTFVAGSVKNLLTSTYVYGMTVDLGLTYTF